MVKSKQRTILTIATAAFFVACLLLLRYGGVIGEFSFKDVHYILSEEKWNWFSFLFIAGFSTALYTAHQSHCLP